MSILKLSSTLCCTTQVSASATRLLSSASSVLPPPSCTQELTLTQAGLPLILFVKTGTGSLSGTLPIRHSGLTCTDGCLKLCFHCAIWVLDKSSSKPNNSLLSLQCSSTPPTIPITTSKTRPDL